MEGLMTRLISAAMEIVLAIIAETVAYFICRWLSKNRKP